MSHVHLRQSTTAGQLPPPSPASHRRLPPWPVNHHHLPPANCHHHRHRPATTPPPVNPLPASCHHRRPPAATAHHRPTTATCRRPSPTNRGLTPLPFIHPKKIEEFVSLKGLEP
ncbi:unnamed protein product [Prunus brigantina]